jgi:hypothetical protein
MRCWTWFGLALIALGAPGEAVAADEDRQTGMRVQQSDDGVSIETDALKAFIRKKGYVSGIAAGSFLDKSTGAREIGFGLHIMDFLMAPGWGQDDYPRDPKFHGRLPKHYVEGPQICTKAKELEQEVIRGEGFVAVRQRYRFTKPAVGFKAGSTWEQTLIFQPERRYVLSSEVITSVNTVHDLFYRIDMPGHVKHKGDDTFAQVYLSYHGKIPADAFAEDFAPDAKYLYQRREGKVPERMIRAYQVKLNGKPGPWVAGMTLDPTEVSEAWCHERGYICFIEELHRRPVKAGERFGAAYVVGFFDDIGAMEKVYDQYKGANYIDILNGKYRLRP